MSVIDYTNLIRGAVLISVNRNGKKYIFLEKKDDTVSVIPIEKDGFASKFIWSTTLLHFFQPAPEDEQMEKLFGSSGKFNMQLYIDYLLRRIYQKNENQA